VPVTLRTRPAETTREIELSVAGMTCAACAIRVQKKLSKLDGVTASVNYAAAVGIDEVIAETLPAGKAEVITGLQARGHAVAMVGDGVNDAPALAAATIGLAMGSGTDVAMSAADLILLRDDLTVAADAIRLSRATFRTIRHNLAWAFGYNLAALPLAALGFLNPIVASAAMTLSSVFVVWNSLRLRRFTAGSY
jgi:Cu+-exporting ATPase